MFASRSLQQPKKRWWFARWMPPLAGRMLYPGSMKYVAVFLIAGGAYFFLARQAPVAPAVNAITQAPTPGTDFLKRPLDRTQEVLKQARTRTQDPALQ